MGSEPDAVLALLREVKEKYGDVPYWRGTLGEKAGRDIFEIENLAVGKVGR